MDSFKLSGSDSITDDSAMLAAGVTIGELTLGGVCTGLALGVTSGVGMGLPGAKVCRKSNRKK